LAGDVHAREGEKRGPKKKNKDVKKRSLQPKKGREGRAESEPALSEDGESDLEEKLKDHEEDSVYEDRESDSDDDDAIQNKNDALMAALEEDESDGEAVIPDLNDAMENNGDGILAEDRNAEGGDNAAAEAASGSTGTPATEPRNGGANDDGHMDIETDTQSQANDAQENTRTVEEDEVMEATAPPPMETSNSEVNTARNTGNGATATALLSEMQTNNSRALEKFKAIPHSEQIEALFNFTALLTEQNKLQAKVIDRLLKLDAERTSEIDRLKGKRKGRTKSRSRSQRRTQEKRQSFEVAQVNSTEKRTTTGAPRPLQITAPPPGTEPSWRTSRGEEHDVGTTISETSTRRK